MTDSDRAVGSEPAESRPSGSVQSLQGPIWAFLMHRVINPLMRRVLSSRIHARAGSDTLMVLTFTGRASGRLYTFPIGYMQEGNTLISYSPYTWWRNLVGGAPVSVLLRGRTRSGTAEVFTETSTIEEGMAVYLVHNPGDAKYFKVSFDGEGHPDPEDVARAARLNVQIRITLD